MSDAPLPAPPTAPPPTAPPPTAPPGPALPGAGPTDAVPAADPAVGDLAGWAGLVGRLYAERARAYATADSAPLAGVYAPGSPLLQRDAEQVARLARAGQTVVGYDPTVLRVTSVTAAGDRVRVDLVDEVPGHRVVAAGDAATAAQQVGGRGPAEVRMTLHRTGSGWRITDAELRE
jgi:plastocyanin